MKTVVPLLGCGPIQVGVVSYQFCVGKYNICYCSGAVDVKGPLQVA